MKILHITDGIPPLSLGGTGRIVTDLALAQARSGLEVGILTSTPGGKKIDEPETVKIFVIPARPERWAHFRCVFSRSREREVLKIIDSFRPDIVHAHTVSRQCGYRWMAKLKNRGIKLVVTCHDVSSVAHGKVTAREKALWWSELKRYRFTWNPFRRTLIRHFLKNADRILAVSDTLKDYLLKQGLSNLRTLRNGIDLDFWKPTVTQAEARQKLKLPQNRFIFLLAGRMGYDKGSTLIAATLPKNADLVLAGDRFSDEFKTVKDRMHIFYNQSPEEMKLQYSAADVVLVPSRCLDCFPTVCLEAMAMERPVMATSWGGAKESIVDGATGWIIDPLDETAWSEKMAWCVENKNQLPSVASAGRKRMETRFSLPAMTQALQKIYSSVL